MNTPTAEQLKAIDRLQRRVPGLAPALAEEINILLDALPPEFTKHKLPSGPENRGKAFLDGENHIWVLSEEGNWLQNGDKYSETIAASYLPFTPLVPEREPMTAEAFRKAYRAAYIEGRDGSVPAWQAVADLANGKTR